jgi:hypothetical protein
MCGGLAHHKYPAIIRHHRKIRIPNRFKSYDPSVWLTYSGAYLKPYGHQDTYGFSTEVM